ncbi:MAG: GAF domain-containing protein, partial [Verrucomicrobiales bacterium]|nr:GAF domain-containing protein [Verrucomicrobiales bacterium]
MNPEAASLRSELEALLRFETLLAEVSSRFIILPAERIDRAIDDALREVCEHLDLDGSALWEAQDSDWGSMLLTHIHRPVGGPAIPLSISAAREFPWCLSEVRSGGTIVVSSIETEVPRHAVVDREGFRRYGVKSVLDIPLSSVPDEPFGVLTFFTVQAERL